VRLAKNKDKRKAKNMAQRFEVNVAETRELLTSWNIPFTPFGSWSLSFNGILIFIRIVIVV
jgi:hypothetical protein